MIYRHSGDFDSVQDSTVLQLLETNGILTLGMDSRDIDWQRAWREQLNKDDRPGLDGAYSCPHHTLPHDNSNADVLAPVCPRFWVILASSDTRRAAIL